MAEYDIKCSRLFFYRSWPYLSIPLLGISAFSYFRFLDSHALQDPIGILPNINAFRIAVYIIIPRSYFDVGLAEAEYGLQYANECLFVYAMWGVVGWLCVLVCVTSTIQTRCQVEINPRKDTLSAAIVAIFTLIISYPKSHYTNMIGTYIDGNFDFFLKESFVVVLGFYMVGFAVSNAIVKMRLVKAKGEIHND